MSSKPIQLGIFGFGCVGQGLYEVLHKTKGINASIKKICIKHPDKERPIDKSLFTTDRDELLNDPEIDVIVELISEADAAYEIVTTALKNKKAVVSASKKMIAEHLEELVQLQKEHQTALLYEASACASIPVIRNLEEYYDNDLLNGIEGIFNGSTNYILTNIFNNNKSFDVALKEAQDKGFAEADPTLDIEGYDAKYKLCILLLHAFGLFVNPEEVFHFGIHRLNDFDIAFARNHQCIVKLLPKAYKTNGKVAAYVLPHLVPTDHFFATIENEYNAAWVESAFSEHQAFVGKGAGGTPTGSAVLSDISALTYQYKYEYKKLQQHPIEGLQEDYLLKIYVRYSSSTVINLTDFENIETTHQSKAGNYLIGNIKLRNLRNAGWLKLPEVNVLAIDNKILHI